MPNRLTSTSAGRTTVGRYSPIIVSTCLVVATLAAYGRVCQNDFANYDDNLYVTQNTHVQKGLTLEGVGWAFTTLHSYNWHPLTWLSLQLDAQLFGTRPWGYHLTNLLLHVLNTLLLYRVFFRMTSRTWCCALVAALFALHPLHVESVAWVSERKDVLSTFFWLLTMLAYVRYVTGPSLGSYLTVVVALGLGLMAKPMLVTLPCVLLLLDYWPLGRWRLRDRGSRDWPSRVHFPFSIEAVRRILATSVAENAKGAARHVKRLTVLLGRGDPTYPFGQLVFEKLPLFALVFASSLVTLYAQSAGGAVKGTNLVTYGERFTFMFVAYERYLRKTAWPNDLCVLYPLELGPRVFWEGVIAGALLAAISLVVLFGARGRPYLLVGWFWYLGTLVPVIGLVKVGAQLMADRYTYVPLIGLFIMAAWGSAELVSRRPSWRWAMVAAATAACAACATVTRLQVETWRNSAALWEQTVGRTAPNATASHNLGDAYLKGGRPGDAIGPLEIALRYDERERSGLAQAHRELGIELMAARNFSDAERHFAQALDYFPGSAPLYNLRGQALAKQGKFDEAINDFVKATRIHPKLAEAWYHWGKAHEAREQWGEASDCFAKALALEPANRSYRAELAHANEH